MWSGLTAVGSKERWTGPIPWREEWAGHFQATLRRTGHGAQAGIGTILLTRQRRSLQKWAGKNMSQTRLGKEKDFALHLLRLQLGGQLGSRAVCDQAGGEKLLRQGVERDGGGCAGFFLKIPFSSCDQGGGKDSGGCDKELRTGVVRFRYFWSN